MSYLILHDFYFTIHIFIYLYSINLCLYFYFIHFLLFHFAFFCIALQFTKFCLNNFWLFTFLYLQSIIIWAKSLCVEFLIYCVININLSFIILFCFVLLSLFFSLLTYLTITLSILFVLVFISHFYSLPTPSYIFSFSHLILFSFFSPLSSLLLHSSSSLVSTHSLIFICSHSFNIIYCNVVIVLTSIIWSQHIIILSGYIVHNYY